MSQDEEQSIYNAPSADTEVGSTDDLMAAWVGPKRADYYAKKFAGFASGGSSASWHWPAFFVSAGWLLYRKMWLAALGYLLGLPIVLGIVMFVLILALGEEAATGIYYGVYFILVFIVFPIFANKLYFNHVRGKVESISRTGQSPEQQAAELRRKGGTSWVAFIVILIPLIGIFAAIAIPAYQDYTIRAQVSEGLNLSSPMRAAVNEYAQEFEEWPADNAAANLPPASDIAGTYVSAVAVVDGVIEISFGNEANSLIQASTLNMVPEASDFPTITWSCYSETIEPKWLPAICRE